MFVFVLQLVQQLPQDLDVNLAQGGFYLGDGQGNIGGKKQGLNYPFGFGAVHKWFPYQTVSDLWLSKILLDFGVMI
jgi:hypothetical protein